MHLSTTDLCSAAQVAPRIRRLWRRAMLVVLRQLAASQRGNARTVHGAQQAEQGPSCVVCWLAAGMRSLAVPLQT